MSWLPTCEYGVVGKEIAASGTPHLQGYVRFKSARACQAVRKLKGMTRAAIFICRGTEKQNDDYCKKEGNFVAVNPENISVGQGTRSDLSALATRLLDGGISQLRNIATEDPATFVRYSRGLMHIAAFSSHTRKLSSPPPCTFAFGPSGSGKSTFIHGLAEAEAAKTGESIYYWGTEWPWIGLGYAGQTIIVIDDIRDVDFKGAKVPLNFVTKIIDVFPLSLQCKGSDVQFHGAKFYISCVLHPSELWKESGNDSNWQFGRRITALYRCANEGGEYTQELLPDARPPAANQCFHGP